MKACRARGGILTTRGHACCSLADPAQKQPVQCLEQEHSNGSEVVTQAMLARRPWHVLRIGLLASHTLHATAFHEMQGSLGTGRALVSKAIHVVCGLGTCSWWAGRGESTDEAGTVITFCRAWPWRQASSWICPSQQACCLQDGKASFAARISASQCDR